MTFGVALLWLLTCAAGASVAGLVRVPLRLEERAAVAIVAGVALGALCSLGTTLAFGMNAPGVLAGPVLLGLLGLGVSFGMGDLRDPWRESLAEVPARWRSRELWPPLALLVAAVTGFSVLFAHTLFVTGQDINAGFSTVWADWSLHATAASSFAVGHNLPPHDPIFSGTPFRYPFLPDFHSGMLLELGASPGAALAVPDAVLCVAAALLLASLARRLTGSVAVGVVAMSICLLGGGVGASGLWWDACARAGVSVPRCAPIQVALHPGDAVKVFRAVPATVADQPRAYDGLLTDTRLQPAGNIQWYTPMMAWWLPQRTFVHGFAIALAVLLLVHSGLARPPPAWSPFLVAGALAGLLPLVHVHSLVALGLTLPLVAAVRRRREWLGLLGVTLVLAVPRLAQIASGGHGVEQGPFGSNAFPYLEPGWKWNLDSDPGRIVSLSTNGIGGVASRIVHVFLTPGFWGFWLLNTGILLPACAVLLGTAAMRLARPMGVDEEERPRPADPTIPDGLALLCAPFMLLFLIANVVVFQSWDWDNTKLFAYWQMAAALLVGAWVVHWWRGGMWRAATATVALASVLLSGGLVMLRQLPWTPSGTNPGSYTWASHDDRVLADQVAARTPRNAVILTGGRPNDPLLILAGRTAVMGYPGWLNSYGTDFGSRPDDVRAMYVGCANDSSCPVPGLLRRYGVSFVELGGWERDNQSANESWWAAHYPVLVRSGDVTVYDVRRS